MTTINNIPFKRNNNVAQENNSRPKHIQTQIAIKKSGKNTVADKHKKTKNSSNDPLTKFPLRYLAYFNEIGAALQHVSQKIFVGMWIPALAYFGASIYDKYEKGENEDGSGKPSGKKAAQEATFQLLASVFLPTKAVHMGQGIAGKLYGMKNHKNGAINMEILDYLSEKFEKDKNTDKIIAKLGRDNYKEDVENEIKRLQGLQFIENLQKKEGLEKEIKESSIKIKEEDLNMSKTKKAVNKFVNFINVFGHHKGFNATFKNDKTREQGVKLLKEYMNELATVVQDPKNKLNIETSAKQRLKELKHTPMIVKTIGGFTSLLLLVKPIDKFVEHVIMEKGVEPLLYPDKHGKTKNPKKVEKKPVNTTHKAAAFK